MALVVLEVFYSLHDSVILCGAAANASCWTRGMRPEFFSRKGSECIPSTAQLSPVLVLLISVKFRAGKIVC